MKRQRVVRLWPYLSLSPTSLHLHIYKRWVLIMLPSHHNIKFWIYCQIQEWPSQHHCWCLKSPTDALSEVPVPSELVLLMELMSFLNCSSKTLGSSLVRSLFSCSPGLHIRLFFNLFSSCRHELSFKKVVCYGLIVLSSFPRSSSNSWWATVYYTTLTKGHFAWKNELEWWYGGHLWTNRLKQWQVVV